MLKREWKRKPKVVYYSVGSLTLRVCERLNMKYNEALEIVQKYGKLSDWGKEHWTHDQAADEIAKLYKHDNLPPTT